MRLEARLVLGFYPLPEVEAIRLRGYLQFPESAFSALDPCIGDGVAFGILTREATAHRYGIELDTWRAEAAAGKAIQVLHGDALEVQCPVESLSLLYLNPPYDFEVGASRNRRFEELFLRHTYRWLKRGGVLVFVIPQQQLTVCAALLAESFDSIRIYRLTSAESVRYHQVAVLAYRRTVQQSVTDRQHRMVVEELKQHAGTESEIPNLSDQPDAQYQLPTSGEVALKNRGFSLDLLEDRLPESSAYRQAARILVRQPNLLRGRPITQLHGGHVALLAASGALNGVFGQGTERHIASWTPARMQHRSVEKEDDGTVIKRRWTSFSPKLLLLYEDGRTKTLSHRKSKQAAEDEAPQADLPISVPSRKDERGEPGPHPTKPDSRKKPRRTIPRRIHLHKS